MPKLRYRPLVLIILDGWGIAPDGPGNAIARAKTPTMDRLITTYPAMTLVSSSEAVGLAWGEMGNSEVGHLSIGSGAVFYQNLPRINKEIETGTFFKNESLLEAIAHVKKTKGALHLMGVCSTGGVHGHIEHLYALLEMCKREKVKKIFIHCFLDGRDAIFNSGKGFVQELEEKIKSLKVPARIATISGRYFAMDRDNHWDRTQKVFDAMVHGIGAFASEPVKAISDAYEKKIYDEEFTPTIITDQGAPIATVADGDSIIFFNFRSDRARQISKAFALPEFNKFDRKVHFKNLLFVAMTEYEKDVPVSIAYPPIIIHAPLAKVLSDAKLKQVHIAETEKYAHVTFFFNGGIEEPFPGEERIVMPSPAVSSYDLKPEMSAGKITDTVIRKLDEDEFDVYIVNFANADMVGHTGNLKATIRAIETLDSCIKKITDAVVAKGGVVFITADHGNAEELQNLQTGKVDKEHSTNPVPFIIVGKEWEGQNAGLPDSMGPDLSLVPPVGTLSDVAPTILHLVGLKPSKDMTGTPLL